MTSDSQILANIHAQRFVLALESWTKSTLFSDFTVSTKFDWSPARRTSRGGIYKNGPGINMAMYWAVPNNYGEVYRFSEYPSFDANPHIGGFYSTNPYDKLEAILAHEVAHAIQFFSYTKTNTRCTPHGPVFKRYYKLLRQEFVNHKLPEQKALHKNYESYVATFSNRAIVIN